jgi:predicted rRNA methylase YqxC with S4 and FtsJ domains
MRYTTCQIDYVTVRAPTVQEALEEVIKLMDRYGFCSEGITPFNIEIESRNGEFLASFPLDYNEDSITETTA